MVIKVAIILNMENKYYLYRHIRLDKNQPFYIGIGTKLKNNTTNVKVIYKRAYDYSKRRNKIWQDITKKTDYEIEILMESDDYSFLLNKEKEFIKLYGRIDNKTGILANMTDGGEGILNPVFDKNRALKISEANKGRVKSISERLLISKNLQKPVIHKETGVIFKSIQDAAKFENVPKSTMYQGVWAFAPSCKYKYLDENRNFPKKFWKLRRGKKGNPVINKETNEIFNTATEAAIYEGVNLHSFYSCLKYKQKYFKYRKLTKLEIDRTL